MKAWIFLCNDSPLEHWIDGYQERFDAWEAGGVTGLAVGRMVFRQDDGSQIAAHAHDPALYAAHGLDAPEQGPRDLDKERKLHAMLDDAARRGWQMLIFAGGGPTARVQDLMTAFPQTQGVIIDGPGEHSYELAFHHGGEVFELNEGTAARFSQIGVDVERARRGMQHLRDRLHQLTPDRVRFHAGGGMLGALQLLDVNEDVLYWLRARQEASAHDWRWAREQIDAVEIGSARGPVQLAGIPRTPAFSGLTGQDYGAMAPYFDLIFPKHYYWHRGFDGMVGTVSRWVKRLGAWNPSLNEADCFAVVGALTGIQLPEVTSLLDLENGHADSFFDEVVTEETRRALEAIGDPSKVIGWVSTGRSPHGGDQMPPRALRGILESAQAAGLQRFLYHPEPDIGAAEWLLISRMCGTAWDEDPKGYWPTGTDLPDTWNGGRPTPDEI
ncbi:MAG: hypothetical protein HN712_01255 [Gemmatimonadetes bacterium]|jgi:hypothetical protein|nr:hypothetical protein [Gemmatimonadota bacterium]MBT6144041.1 hypothetical protein [Gemmatimonadota bacterium]MBT7858899.1 hypothetical protein [Gemmatimonadota bacterium]